MAYCTVLVQIIRCTPKAIPYSVIPSVCMRAGHSAVRCSAYYVVMLCRSVKCSHHSAVHPSGLQCGGEDDGRSGCIMYSVIGSSKGQHLNHAFNGSPRHIITYQYDLNLISSISSFQNMPALTYCILLRDCYGLNIG